MNFRYLLSVISVIITSNTAFCGVLKSPNADDRRYWREYGTQYLKKVLANQGNNVEIAKNCIIFIGDGMGTPTITAGRILKGQVNGASGEETKVVFEDFPSVGLSKTYNTDKQVPDSAGTATAMFTGVKTKYAVIGLDSSASNSTEEKDRLTSIIDWAQYANKRTGIVTTTRITHATPSATYAYAIDRYYECDKSVPAPLKSKFKDIAFQLVENAPGKYMNVIMGGGRDNLGTPLEVNYTQYNFSGKAEDRCIRDDGRNLADFWMTNKTHAKYVTNTKELLEVDPSKTDHLMGLFANNHMTYDYVRNQDPEGEPSLSQMTKAAIEVLNNKNNKNGFVLMVEGGRIDMAHHQNLGRLALYEFLELEKSIQVAVDMLKGTDTLIIVTADHSHAMNFNGYGERGNDIFGFSNKKSDVTYEALTYSTGPGFYRHRSEKMNETWIPMDSRSDEERKEPHYMHLAAVPMKDAAHGGEDVPVFATGKGSNLIQGVFEQNYIAYAISYATCIGPAAPLNEKCSGMNTSTASISNLNLSLIFMSLAYLLVR